MIPLYWTFEADTWCPACAEERGALEPGWLDSEGNEAHPAFSDSVSDTPECCAECGVFLRNSLTEDGYEYVREAVRSAAAVIEWSEFYGITEVSHNEA